MDGHLPLKIIIFFIGETLEKEQMIKWSICKFPSNFLYINLVVLEIASESITTA